jgi:tetratricopeptide (TPR) repeat protein
LAVAALAFAPGPSLAESRVALVIGNGAYTGVPELANPPNDARDMAEALNLLGFKVTLGINLDHERMQEAIAKFKAQDVDVSLLYYAGHGLQLSGHNYLVPVGARLRTADDIATETIPLDAVLEAGKGFHLVFLDACRNTGGAVTPSVGLAPVGRLPGFFIAYATQPDNFALDGSGRNSPFATALLGHLATPGEDISSMMIHVRKDVFAATGGDQVPVDYSLLTEQFYFAGTGERPETQLWRLAGQERDRDLLGAYLDSFSDGPHASDVRALLAGPGVRAVAPSPAEEVILWPLARGERQRRLLELYVKRYPSGAHIEEANALIATLRAARDKSSTPEVECARLATHPEDATAAVNGVDLGELRRNSKAAIDVCQQAAQAHPEVPHYTALLARATYAADRYDEALALYGKAAEAGDTRAMVSLGLMLETGDHVPKKDPKAAYALYEKAAERGSASGALELAYALIEGKGIGRDLPRARELLKKASDGGSARATFDLAALDAQGIGGKPTGETLDLFHRAGADGYPQSYRAAAVLLDEGRGVSKNPAAAAEDLLRGVADDEGEVKGELSAKTPTKIQPWSLETIKELQTRLKSAGYYAGPIDGRSGPQLAPALTRWRLQGAGATQKS